MLDFLYLEPHTLAQRKGRLENLMQQEPVFVSLEFTPNPDTLKFTVNRTLLEKGAVSFMELDQAQGKSALAVVLLGRPGIRSLMMGKDFVTITKSEDGDWDQVYEGVMEALKHYLESGAPVLEASYLEELGMKKTGVGSEIEEGIKSILENEIRPAVAMDGGDISLDRYEHGVVYVHLQGACSGCPSSTATLKHGIEARLKQAFPEVQEVISI
jgi:Fe-S cluster biogenesis protein NfuA